METTEGEAENIEAVVVERDGSYQGACAIGTAGILLGYQVYTSLRP